MNLADPECEPSDAELAGLVARAFANVRAANEQRMRKLREDIARARAVALAELEARARQIKAGP